MTKVKNLLSNIELIESLTRERANTKWNFHKMINIAMFAALLKQIPGGAKTQYCQIHHWKKYYVKQLTFEQSTRKPYNDTSCLFRALALHLHQNFFEDFSWMKNYPRGSHQIKSFCMAFRWKCFLYVLTLRRIGSTGLLVGEIGCYLFPINWILLYGVHINKPNFQGTPIYIWKLLLWFPII